MRNKKGFTLIELLAVIIILAVIALIATPIVLNVIDNARKSANKDSAYGLLDSAKLYYMESLLDESKSLSGNLIYKINVSGSKPNSGTVYINDKGEIALAVVYDKICFTKNYEDADLTESDDIENCNIPSLPSEPVSKLYKDSILNGADPELKDNLVAVTINTDGTVKKADIYSEWYNYTNKTWANAVTLKDKTINYEINQVIPESNIDGYFVWIPRYKYEIFNLGNYNGYINGKPSTSTEQEIKIVFESKSTSKSTGNVVGSYLTHPAFTLGTEELDGIWVGKFETSGSTTDIDVLPNVTSLRSINVKTMFELAYNYDRSLDSHMMKNTEWGAVAYLSHSEYGINSEIRINNSAIFTTGCAAITPALNYVGKSQSDHSEGYYNGCEMEYNTDIGYLSSTTGNISGIYDMNGGAWEYMASYISNTYGSSGFDASSISNYDNKYFDIYPADSVIVTYNKRVLGDATGELGPFYSYKERNGSYYFHSTWGADNGYFVSASSPWFLRGGDYSLGAIAGSFASSSLAGSAYSGLSFRLVLAD